MHSLPRSNDISRVNDHFSTKIQKYDKQNHGFAIQRNQPFQALLARTGPRNAKWEAMHLPWDKRNDRMVRLTTACFPSRRKCGLNSANVLFFTYQRTISCEINHRGHKNTSSVTMNREVSSIGEIRPFYALGTAHDVTARNHRWKGKHLRATGAFRKLISSDAGNLPDLSL